MEKIKSSLIRRFLLYQKERFPILIILITGISVILSSATVVILENDSLLNKIPLILLAITVSFLFIFHIRVIDEHRDYKFDSAYHKDRPVQSGIISLKELMILNVVGLLIQFFINFFLSTRATIIWFVAFGYTVISGNDFFLGDKIKRKLFLYNGLNLIQLFIFQFYLYSIFNPNFSFLNILLFSHFIFAATNISLLEFARKMKSSKEESKVKDTYSSRFGRRGASLIFIIISLISFILFSYTLFELKTDLLILTVGLIFLNLIVISSSIYFIKNNKASEFVIQGIAALFYIATHLLIAFSRI